MFEKCPMCGFAWSIRDEFLADPDVTLIGYQVNFCDLLAGYFLFTHSCGTSLALHAAEFPDLHEGPMFDDRLIGGDDCPGYCLRKEELRPCPVQCECAFVREVLQIIKTWPKDARQTAPEEARHNRG